MKEKIKTKIKELKKEFILQEASSYIEESGYDSLKINELAKRCKVSVGYLYQLFESKEKLFYEYVIYQIREFYNSLCEACKEIDSPDERLIIFTKMKLKIFKQKRDVIQDPVTGDPLFFMKLSKKDPSIIIKEFLKPEFEKLSHLIPLKSNNFLKLSHIYSSYVLGYIQYCFNEDSIEDCDENTSKEIFENFLEGIKK